MLLFLIALSVAYFGVRIPLLYMCIGVSCMTHICTKQHPDYAHSRNSLTVAPETVWPRVGSSHFADQNNHIGLLIERDC